MALRWGIASAGKISSQFAKSVLILPRNEHQLAAVAAQNQEPAQNFAKELNISKVNDNYVSFVEDDNIGDCATGHFVPGLEDVSLSLLTSYEI